MHDSGDRTAGQTRRFDPPFSWVRAAAVRTLTLFGEDHGFFLMETERPMAAVSTLEGMLSEISRVGNLHVPDACWDRYAAMRPEETRRRVLSAAGRPESGAALLFTGVQMKNLAMAVHKSDGLAAAVFATAGAESNALRASRDAGNFVEPGTVNLILLTNRRLSQPAMLRAVVTATEAKTAVFEDLDVRSRCTPIRHAATGTGTDNVVILAGEGADADLAGGHARLGELIARAVYDAVRESLDRRPEYRSPRSLEQRMRERGLIPERAAIPAGEIRCHWKDRPLAGFLECALAIQDAHERGLVENLDLFHQWCRAVGDSEKTSPFARIDLPPVLRAALGAAGNPRREPAKPA
jgi:adenosylcobinamide amidohydrolase